MEKETFVDEQLSEPADYRGMAADIVAAYVSHNTLSPADLPKLLTDTHNQLIALVRATEQPLPVSPPVPAVAINRSVKEAAITCLDCGRAFKSLKRHIQSEHDINPTEYRAKWGLTHDYPMVAPSYSVARSALAKKIGLGRKKTIGA